MMSYNTSHALLCAQVIASPSFTNLDELNQHSVNDMEK